MSTTKAKVINRLTDWPTTGMAVDRSSLSLVTRYDPTESADGEVLHIRRGRTMRRLKIMGATDAHDVISHQGRLSVVSSYRNAVITADSRRGNVMNEVFLGPTTNPDEWHPNDFCKIDGQTWVSCFADPRDGANWHQGHYGRGFLQHLKTGERVGRFNLPHSAVQTTEGIYLCDSGTSSVVLVDRQGNERRRRELSGFTRGLLVADQYVIVGVSAHRLASKSTQARSPSRVHVLRRSDLSELSVIDIPASEIYSLRLVSRWHLKKLRRIQFT